MRKLFFLVPGLIGLSLTACSTVLNNLPGVYTLEVQQGNIVDQDMINQLRPNMTKRQVLYVMGSPMLTDAFHQKRWDYLYARQVEGEAREQKRISLYFDGDILTGIQGDFRPDNQAKPAVKETTVDVPPRDLEKTMWEKIVWLFSDEPDIKPVAQNEEKEASKPITTEPELKTHDTEQNIKAEPMISVPVK